METLDSRRHDDFVKQLSRHASRIYAFILTMSPNRSDADDIFQSTNLTMWKIFDTFQEGTNFWAWASQVAYHEVLNHRRQQERHRRILSDEAVAVLAAEALIADAEIDQQEEILAQCMAKLRERDQQLIRSRYFESQSPRQIAEHSSRSVYSVYRALTRIHEALLTCMQRAMSDEAVQ